MTAGIAWVRNSNHQPTVHFDTCRYFKQAKPQNVRAECVATARTMACRVCKPPPDAVQGLDIPRRAPGAPRPDYVAPRGTKWVRGALLPPPSPRLDSRRREARRLARMWRPSQTWASQSPLPFEPDWVVQLVCGKPFDNGYLAGRRATGRDDTRSAEDVYFEWLEVEELHNRPAPSCPECNLSQTHLTWSTDECRRCGSQLSTPVPRGRPTTVSCGSCRAALRGVRFMEDGYCPRCLAPYRGVAPLYERWVRDTPARLARLAAEAAEWELPPWRRG